MKILIGTNTFGSNLRQDIAVKSWQYLKTLNTQIDIIDLRFKDDPSFYTDIISHDCLTRSSENMLKSKQQLPVVGDMLTELWKYAMINKYDYIVFTNSDIIIMHNLLDYIEANNPTSFSCSRMDIEPIDSFNKILQQQVKALRWEPAGIDSYIYNVHWLTENGNIREFLFNHEYFYGQPIYDVVLTGKMMLYDKTSTIHNTYPPKIFHQKHENNWVNKSTLEKDWNERIFKHKNYIVDHMIYNMMFYHLQNILCHRKPFGSFMNIPDEEKQKTNDYFSIMNLDIENSIKRV